MGYVERQGDVLTMGLPAIGHGCDISGFMGGGLGRLVTARWPEMHAEYVRLCGTEEFTLGRIFVWDAGDVIVYNLATQVKPGKDARLGAVRSAVRDALADAYQRGITQLGIPRLGADVGGLEWRDVRRALREVGWASPVELVVVNLPRPVKN